MKMSARLLALTIAALFIGSTMTAFVGPIELENRENSLDEEIVVSRAATSPGHSVFAEYYGADWCPPCQNGGSPSMHALKTNFPDDYVYISYYEANGQGVSDPLNRLSHMRDGTGSIPAAVFGDARRGVVIRGTRQRDNRPPATRPARRYGHDGRQVLIPDLARHSAGFDYPYRRRRVFQNISRRSSARACICVRLSRSGRGRHCAAGIRYR